MDLRRILSNLSGMGCDRGIEMIDVREILGFGFFSWEKKDYVTF